ncbi:MAG: sugar transferase [Candidatus Omnitrophica bacterium]|nr:sugar transferase [Candidatus Omnitrophota bacterium]
MIREKENLFRQLLMALDIFVVCASFLVSYALRKHIHNFYPLDLFPDKVVMDKLFSLEAYFNVMFLLVLAWWIALINSGLYKSFRKKRFIEVIWRIIRSAFFAMVIYSIAVFAFKLHFISRSLIVFSFFVSTVFLIIERWMAVVFMRSLRKKGHNHRNILVVGTGQRAGVFVKLVDKHDEWGLRIIGLIDVDKGLIGNVIYGKKVIGILEDMPAILSKEVIDEVVFIVPRSWLCIIEDSLLACETQGVKTSIAADFFNMNIAHSASSDIEGIPFLEFKTTIGGEWQLLLKRLFDIIFSSVIIVVALPVFMALFVLIKLFYGDPVIFKQVRSGLHGREFVMYKFRTMVNGADGKKQELSSLNEMDGPAFKMRDDPRVTRFGNFLRRTSMDELPQFFNIVKGNMSVVGPRPPITSEVKKYKIWQRRRLSMKPGLTCLWQVNGRNNVDFDKWMNLDLKYIDSWSLGLDIKILLKTIPAVLFSIGAR